jgi:hypothetical protein
MAIAPNGRTERWIALIGAPEWYRQLANIWRMDYSVPLSAAHMAMTENDTYMTIGMIQDATNAIQPC